MEILDKHSKDIHSLLKDIKNLNCNKIQINELLCVSLSSLCKYVSGKDNFKDSSTLDNIIYGKQDDKIVVKKDEIDMGELDKIEKFNDLDIDEKSLQISKIDNLKNNNNKANNKEMTLSFYTEKTLEYNKIKKQTLELDNDDKMNVSKFNEINFDHMSEKEDISTIYNVKLDNSFQTNFLDPFDKDEKNKRNNMNNSFNYSYSSDMNKKDEQKDRSYLRSSLPMENKHSKELKTIKDLVNNELSEKDILKISKEMSVEYIIDLYGIYQKMRKYASKNFEVENIMFVNRFKQFLLEIGISEKRLYEQCIRLIIYKKNIFTFYDFHLCFHKILNLKYEFNFLKYKLLYHLTNKKNDKIIEVDELERFMILLKSARIYDPDVYNRINIKLKEKYKEIFPKLNTLHFRKLSLVLELFFNIR